MAIFDHLSTRLRSSLPAAGGAVLGHVVQLAGLVLGRSTRGPTRAGPLAAPGLDPAAARPGGEEVVLLDMDMLLPNPYHFWAMGSATVRRARQEADMLRASPGTWWEPQVLVCRDEAGGYVLVAGRYQLEVARRLGMRQVPCRMVPGSEQTLLFWSVSEALQCYLSDADRARLAATLASRWGLRLQDVGELLGISKSNACILARIGSNEAALLSLEQGWATIDHLYGLMRRPWWAFRRKGRPGRNGAGEVRP